MLRRPATSSSFSTTLFGRRNGNLIWAPLIAANITSDQRALSLVAVLHSLHTAALPVTMSYGCRCASTVISVSEVRRGEAIIKGGFSTDSEHTSRRLGVTLLLQALEIEKMRRSFGLLFLASASWKNRLD
jgi:hypothetical protein